MRRLTSSKPFDFDADPDHDPDSGISEGNFFTISIVRFLQNQRSLRRFALTYSACSAFITFAKKVMFLPLCVCQSGSKVTQNIVDEY